MFDFMCVHLFFLVHVHVHFHRHSIHSYFTRTHSFSLVSACFHSCVCSHLCRFIYSHTLDLTHTHLFFTCSRLYVLVLIYARLHLFTLTRIFVFTPILTSSLANFCCLHLSRQSHAPIFTSTRLAPTCTRFQWHTFIFDG